MMELVLFTHMNHESREVIGKDRTKPLLGYVPQRAHRIIRYVIIL